MLVLITLYLHSVICIFSALTTQALTVSGCIGRLIWPIWQTELKRPVLMKQIAAAIYFVRCHWQHHFLMPHEEHVMTLHTPYTCLIYSEDGKAKQLQNIEGAPACILMQTHTYLLKSSAWVEAPLTECPSRKPFSHTGPNKPVLLVSLIPLTHTLHPLTSLSFKCQSHDMQGERRICLVCALVCARAYAHTVECDTFCPINDGNQQAITAHAAAVVLQVSHWPPNESRHCLKI